MDAYITGLGVCLPNEPVTNDRIATICRVLNQQPSTLKDLILEHNGIHSRHYAIDPETGRQTHTNAQMTAEAVHDMAGKCGLDLDSGDVEVLACGTSSPDQLIPNHASMVHGLLGCPPCELASLSGVCCSGMAALKYGYLSVLSGTARSAVVTGSEIASVGVLIRNQLLQGTTPQASEPEAFESAFLRWMLSDGAGALLIEPRPRETLSLHIDWVETVSLANELETCMYCGAVKAEDGSLRTWRELANFDDVLKGGYFNLGQDVRLLNHAIVPIAMRRSLEWLRERRSLAPGDIDWLLPHLSSYYFRQPIYDTLVEMGFEIPKEKWFTNLDRKGNTGAASVYIMLEELCSSGRLKRGDRLLCAVPESARFSFAYAHLTVV